MSSKYNRRRKVQAQPEFCYAKKPGRLNIEPCPDGPAIGPNPWAILTISKFGAATPNTAIFTGRCSPLTPDPCYDGYGGPAEQPLFAFTFCFNCTKQTWSWSIVDLTGFFPSPNTWSQANIKYTGGRQLDTGAVNAAHPHQPSNWLTTIRFQL